MRVDGPLRTVTTTAIELKPQFLSLLQSSSFCQFIFGFVCVKFKFTVVMVSVSCSQGLSWIKSCVLLEMVMVCRRSQQHKSI